jgi:hypothetical protein
MTEFPSTRLRLQQQLRRQRQMQQEQRNPYEAGPSSAGPSSVGDGGGGNTLPPRQEQAQPDSTGSQAQQRHSANQ